MTSARDEPVPFKDALLILRRKLFPFQHDPHPWIEGNSNCCFNRADFVGFAIPVSVVQISARTKTLHVRGL